MIQLSNLTKAFGDRVLLDHVTWQISPRERVGLCGPNGAGKTTLLRMMAGLDDPDEGAVLRRLADAHRARQAAARPAESAAARRADQSSRSRRAQLARNVSERIPARG